MSLYEGMFVLDNRQANRDLDGSIEKVKAMLTKHNAEIVQCRKWGERRLAYEIAGRRRGAYVLVHFNATGVAVNDIYRECELSDMVLRALIVKTDAVPSEEQMFMTEDVPLRRGRYDMIEERGRPRGPARRSDEAAESDAPAAEKSDE